MHAFSAPQVEGRAVSDSEGEDEGADAGAVADAEAEARAEGATVERMETGRAAGMRTRCRSLI
jgi:hypothetical protein